MAIEAVFAGIIALLAGCLGATLYLYRWLPQMLSKCMDCRRQEVLDQIDVVSESFDKSLRHVHERVDGVVNNQGALTSKVNQLVIDLGADKSDLALVRQKIEDHIYDTAR